jgi:tRNA pseudouridine55 synthase
MSTASGALLVDKPVGPSSFAVVRRIRQRFGGKVGHAGTLDPLASGLLIVLIGPATRLARYLVGLDKRYVTEIELGQRTTTGDAEGEALERTPVPESLEGALADLVGEVELPVPAASAVKVGGERAYRLHRRGVAVDMPLRRMLVHSATVLRYVPPVVELELEVGSGTYVRAIADALGGHCRALRRTAVGPFRVEDADEDRVLSPNQVLQFLPELALSPDEVGRVLGGQSIRREGEGRARLAYDGGLIAVARLGGGLARPETVVRKGGGLR